MSAIPFIKKYNLKQNAPTILFLGGISQEKGTLTILNVFKILLQRLPDAHLLVAGYLDLAPSPLFKRFFSAQKYKNAVQQALYCLQNSVTILGPINNVPQVMAASTVIVFPATVGHFARPVIEAGFMKKPVIASDLPALDELVINGKTGFLVSPYDIDQWVKVLAYILKDTEQQSLMGEQAYTFCKHHFDLLRYGKKIAEIYDQLANKGD
jgi:glycosyltransferase involved in cell wall biosynthesis